MAMVCMQGILAKQNKTKDHSPSMTLSKGCLNKDDLGPLKLPRYLATLLSWSYDDPRPSRLHPKMELLTKSMVSQQCQRNENAQERHLSR